MPSSQPLISVGMPVFNGQRYLAQAIEAVLGQTLGDFELLVSDNASTDATEQICHDYAAQDDRVRYFRNTENIGAAGNYNQLFRRSTGQFFRWFNADDLSTPKLHERCLEALRAYPDASMAHGRAQIIDGEGKALAPYVDKLDLRQESAAERLAEFFDVVGQTNAIYGLMRREALAKTSLMGNGAYPAADTYLMAELALHGKIIQIPEILFFRRMHAEASSWNRRNEKIQQAFWVGQASRFFMPTVKRELVLWRAMRSATSTPSERHNLKKYLIRRMLWLKGDIAREALRAAVSMPFTSRQ